MGDSGQWERREEGQLFLAETPMGSLNTWAWGARGAQTAATLVGSGSADLHPGNVIGPTTAVTAEGVEDVCSGGYKARKESQECFKQLLCRVD